MPSVAEVLRQYGPAYLERFGAAMPPEHKKVLQAIAACRTGELGTAWSTCASRAVRRTPSPAPAATGIARVVSGERPPVGSNRKPPVCCPVPTSW